MPPKKDWALYFATVYAFSAFVALAVTARRFPKFGLACVGAVSVLGMAGYAALLASFSAVSRASSIVPTM